MDFATLPPEIISAQMYSGPGSGPMLAAATAWDGLAAELQAAADSYGSAISGLTGESWTGPSSVAMTAAATPFVAWMATASAQAKEAALQARAAASAYETAFAATVPPPAIAANRTQLASLVATNVLGQNTAAIAVTEAQYRAMWAQDSAAMYGYAGAAAAAAQLTPFTTPPQTTNAGGQAAQGAAVANATAASTGSAALDALASGDLLGLIPGVLKDLATAASQGTMTLGGLINGAAGSGSAASIYQNSFATLSSIGKFSTVINDSMSVPNMGMVQFKTFWHPPALPDIPKSALGAGLGGNGMSTSAGLRSAVSASVGEAPVVGSLSVPPGWATATPAIRLATNVLPATSVAAAPMADLATGALGAGAMGSLAGGALGGSAPRITSVRGRSTGNGKNAPVKLDRVLAKLQQSRDEVQHWQVDQAGLDDLLDELSKKPGFHAVHVAPGGDAPASTPESSLG